MQETHIYCFKNLIIATKISYRKTIFFRNSLLVQNLVIQIVKFTFEN